MAGLTKEQRAERAAAKLATVQVNTNTPAPQEQQLVAMITDFPAFPGGPNTANVHPDEVENWKAHGWKEME
ncbi:hypothetical protein ML100_004075 [Klebsiella pneumoniae]|uniref:hypothetical protein n=1 Tax=Klebsiella pneumoniae complex TaxID=3390273 RepID=UPI00106B1043|nr:MULTISPECIES: hypothetical protein [Klebsiella]EIX9657080.1 hypothetical protein [Klebsiella pneumoniae]EIX9668495.1 hypothetical protein [Klebsiella pneumoniae]EJC6281387.1 hypothetical protein [Klebsiella pneumoniae]EJC6286819.1 hypothetical protein [Klebsiella pneumoniae]MCS6746962.1 hypothetical protein [Klebsiella quasipneumoniae]